MRCSERERACCASQCVVCVRVRLRMRLRLRLCACARVRVRVRAHTVLSRAAARRALPSPRHRVTGCLLFDALAVVSLGTLFKGSGRRVTVNPPSATLPWAHAQAEEAATRHAREGELIALSTPSVCRLPLQTACGRIVRCNYDPR